MKAFSRLLLGGAVCWAGLTGCAENEPDRERPKKEETPPPAIEARPKPGVYPELVLDVEIHSDQPGLTYYFGVDEEPDLADGEAGKLRVRINRSASILVTVGDEDGNLWGPYSFAYTLEAPVAVGSCSVSVSRYFSRPDEAISLGVDYAFANGISLLYYSIDGADHLIGGPDVLDPAGTVTLPVGPISGDGLHAVACKIRSDNEVQAEQQTEVFIDGTPPTGAWLSVGGAFTRANWPGEFYVQASDLGSGVELVQLCKTGVTPCLDLDPAGTGVFAYATVLTGESAFQTSLTPVITDRAGNQTALAPLTIDAFAFGEAPPASPLSITLTTASAIDLNAVLALAGRAVPIAEARSPDLAETYDPAALPLTPGWNDFLYRQTGNAEWTSFGIYRAGISITYPASASPWLVFASQSTTPGMQGALVDVVPAGPGGAWAKAWFDVPHVWFVADHNANQRWDDADDLWLTPGDAFAGPYQARLAPVAASLTQKASVPATSSDKTVVCAACAAAGELFFDWRQHPYAYPESHAAFPLVSFAPLTDSVVSVWSEPAGWCGFFWDENGDGAVNGQEPRSYGSCGNATFVLAKHEALEVRFADGRASISGLPYGGMVTGELLVAGGAAVLHREAVLTFRDLNGTGNVTAAVQRPMSLPYSLRISNGNESATVSLPVDAPAESVWIDVQDENGDAVSAVAVVQRGEAAYGAVYEAGGGQVAVGLPPQQDGLAAQAFGLRDGYLSVAAPVTGSAMPVRILSPAVTGRFIGTVKDRYGFAVSNATLTWKGFAYSAKTLTDAQGWYALPASGYSGVVHVTAPGSYVRDVYFPVTITRETRLLEVVMADESGPAWPLGANLGIWPEELWGAYVAPAYAGDMYYSARVTTGVWTVRSSYGTARRVSLPGALPPLSTDSPDRKFPPNHSALDLLDHYARCGDRLQVALAFVGAALDSACWGWFADYGEQEYVLGTLPPASGFPAMRGLGVLNASVTGPGTALELVDVLLGRVIRVAVGSGTVRAAVPVGVYVARGSGGGTATPAFVVVHAIDNPSIEIFVP